VDFQWLDEWDGGFGWQVAEAMGRTSHAVSAGGGVWLIDPVEVDGLEARIAALGDPVGVLQLLDRHDRDCAASAALCGVPHLRAWVDAGPFEAVPVRDNRFWREAALWEPESGTLICADVLGTLPFFRAPGERIGWHPLIRPFPPAAAFARLAPERILVGHGAGVFDDAAGALQEPVVHGRRRLPAALLALLRTSVSAASTRRARGR
jgi:hypothetical protein